MRSPLQPQNQARFHGFVKQNYVFEVCVYVYVVTVNTGAVVRTRRRRFLDSVKILAEGGTLRHGRLGAVAKERDRGITSTKLRKFAYTAPLQSRFGNAF